MTQGAVRGKKARRHTVSNSYFLLPTSLMLGELKPLE
jgi:hypothetical protein